MADEPDAGPWEFRGSEQIHTYSVAMSWAGCDRLARVARWLRLDERAVYWEQQAQALRSTILERAWNPRARAFTSCFGGTDLDSTAMLLPELGLLPATDPRFVATVDAIERLLKDGDWMFRYRHLATSGPRTAFTVCASVCRCLPRWDGARKRATSSRACSPRARGSVCCRRTSTHTSELWATFRRRTVSSASSIPPCA
jgi:hypothetical protein